MTSTAFKTVFGSLDNYQKGSVEIVKGKASHYVFSNVFEVAERSAPYEKVVVGKNLDYVIETLRAEGRSPGSPVPTTSSPSPWTATSASISSSSIHRW